MLSEFPLIIGRNLNIGRQVDGFPSLTVQQVVCPLIRIDTPDHILLCDGVSACVQIVEWIAVPGQLIIGNAASIQHGPGRKTLRDKRQVLIQLKLSAHVGSAVFPISLGHLGVRIKIITAIIAIKDMMGIRHQFCRIIGREEDGVGLHDLVVGTRSALDRPLVLVECAAQTDDHLRRLGDIDIDVRSERIRGQVNVVIVIVPTDDIQDTRIMLDGCGRIIAGYIAAARHVDVGPVIDGKFLEHYIMPVGIWIFPSGIVGIGIADLVIII